MFSRLRKLLASTKPAPQLFEFPSTAAWLEAWVAHRISAAQRGHAEEVLHLGGQPAVYVFGSLGLDTAIDRSGKFWIAEYELHEEAAPVWREASECEQTWIGVCASKRLPELKALCPSRPVSAASCDLCCGTGFVHNNAVICEACCALGWLRADGT